MFDDVEDATLLSRLKGVEDAQNRARLAFFVLIYATGATLFGLWNMYLSWERQWSFTKEAPKEWGRAQVLAQQIKSWVDGQSIGISLLGLRVSVSDINVLGTFVLFILSLYYCMCARRENHEIGSLLVDTQSDDRKVRNHVFLNIKSGMVLNPTSSNDAPYKALNEVRRQRRIMFSRISQTVLVFLPVITILMSLLSDLYFCFLYKSPWRYNEVPAWYTLEPVYKQQMVATDIFSFLMGVGTFVFCRYIFVFNSSTNSISHEYSLIINSEPLPKKEV